MNQAIFANCCFTAKHMIVQWFVHTLDSIREENMQNIKLRKELNKSIKG